MRIPTERDAAWYETEFYKLPKQIPAEWLPEDHWARKLAQPYELVPRGVLLWDGEAPVTAEDIERVKRVLEARK